MPTDNTVINPGSGGDGIATDDVTTLNGAGSSGIKVQRVKVCFGDDGDSRDASIAFGLPVRQEAISKGVQGTRGVATQSLKDSGRAIIAAATAIGGVALVGAEAMLTLDQSRSGVVVGSVTSFGALNAGVRLRISGILVGIIATGAAVVSARVSLRMNPSGAAIVTSPILLTIPLSSGPAIAQQGNEIFVPVPDGMEFSGTNQIGLSQVASAAAGTVWASLIGFEY